MSAAKEIKLQCKLRQGNEFLVCWLAKDPRLKRGVQVTLKDGPEGRWTIVEIWTARATDTINRGWDNDWRREAVTA